MSVTFHDMHFITEGTGIHQLWHQNMSHCLTFAFPVFLKKFLNKFLIFFRPITIQSVEGTRWDARASCGGPLLVCTDEDVMYIKWVCCWHRCRFVTVAAVKHTDVQNSEKMMLEEFHENQRTSVYKAGTDKHTKLDNKALMMELISSNYESVVRKDIQKALKKVQLTYCGIQTRW